MRSTTRGAFGSAILVLALGVGAATAAETVMTQNDVSFVSGGIGLDSQERLKAREKEFNLKLVFTLTEGNYLSDVEVKLADAKGRTLVEHVADGPFFMAKAPAGSYEVRATYAGKTQTRKVKLGTGLRTEYFRWPADPKTDTVLPSEGRGK